MTEILKCITPVDGSVYVERPLADDAEVAAALAGAQDAQTGRAEDAREVHRTHRADHARERRPAGEREHTFTDRRDLFPALHRRRLGPGTLVARSAHRPARSKTVVGGSSKLSGRRQIP